MEKAYVKYEHFQWVQYERLLKTTNKLKEKLKILEKYNRFKQTGIYKLESKDYNKVYIGQTGRKLQKHLCGHIQLYIKHTIPQLMINT